MSADLEGKAAMIMMCCGCASCVCASGIAELDDIKLMESALARYCSDDIRKPEHWTQPQPRLLQQHGTIFYKGDEERDKILFRQPESSHLGDCPICFLPLPLEHDKSILHSCCSKIVCKGCSYVNTIREFKENSHHACPFCRQPLPKTREDAERNRMNRIAANDPVALRRTGSKYQHEGDYERAIEFYTRAADLGDADAHFDLSLLYQKGEGVEKDEEKEVYHLGEAAIRGHPDARCNLASYEGQNDERIDRAVKHLIIAANLGHGESMQMLKELNELGSVSDAAFVVTLRTHEAAVDAMKSPQREEAEGVKAKTARGEEKNGNSRRGLRFRRRVSALLSRRIFFVRGRRSRDV